jgi:hypothetical protein
MAFDVKGDFDRELAARPVFLRPGLLVPGYNPGSGI